MFKGFFITRQPDNEIEAELERVMQTIQDRMERMLAAEEKKRLRFMTPDTTPSYYR